MKHLFLLLFISLLTMATNAQIGIGTTTPNSTLDVRGSVSTNLRTFTGATSATATDNILLFTGTTATTLTLPTAASITGRSYQVKNASLTGPTPVLTIATTSSQTIDGLTSWTLNGLYQTVTVVSDGSNWKIVNNLPSSSTVSWSQTGNSNINPAINFLGTSDDKQMILKSNGQSYLEFGRRQTLGLTQGYTDYDDNNEKVTYVRSALQFEAPNASFYKPKMYTDVNGNFRVKGSSAGTDFFEFGSTGAANDGGFEFIIGDDGDEPIVFKSYHYINGMSEIMRLQSGRMAVGSNAFNATNPEKLLIDAGTTTSYNLMTGKGSIDNYLQINVQNRSTGASASSDLVATSDNGSETSNYIDMGINGGGNTSTGILGGANTAYLYAAGNDFVIGNSTASKNLSFFTGGTTVTNERMRIDGSGNVGIGITNPSYKLHVNGTNPLFLNGVQTGAATDSILTIINGVVKKLHPSAYASNTAWIQGGNTFSSLQKFGTVSNHDIPFITNNTEKMRITAAGSVGIGTTTFNGTNPEELIVDAGATGGTAFQNVIVGKGNTNSYAQLNIQNGSAGTAASSDVVATANNGNESINFIDMGINSGGNTSGGILGGANTAYLYATGNDFVIGNSTENKNLIFYTTVPTATSTERMRVTGDGVKVSGSLSVAYRSGTGAYTLASTDYVVINTGAAATWTLPAAATCAGKVYRLLNHGTGNITLSIAVSTANATTTTNLSFIAGTNYAEIISDGTAWRMLN